jgi:Na+/H+ antiporter NhaA
MRKISIHADVCAILLIASFYGSTSLPVQTGKTAQGIAVIMQKAVTSIEVKRRTGSTGFYLSKSNNLKPFYSNAVIHATVVTEKSFFNHSATIQHYINTL